MAIGHKLMSVFLELDSLHAWILVISLLLIAYWYQKNRHLPPGPYGLPLVGYGLFFEKDRAKVVRKLCHKYQTDILSLSIYGKTLVFLDSYELVKECFVKRSDLVDRIDKAFLNSLDEDYLGLIGNSGKSWKEHRRFSLYMMRDFGMGKVKAEDSIHQETEMAINHFRSFKGEAFDPQSLVNMAVSNIICSIIYGRRYEYTDEDFRTSLNAMNDIVRKSGGARMSFLMRTRWGKYLIPGKMAEILECLKMCQNFTRRNVEEHKARYDGQVNDLIDAYLREINDNSKSSQTSTFTEEHLPYLIMDMFIAGSETTFTTLRWALLYMAAYPDVQEKVYDELNSVIGMRLPSMSDKKQTPYTEAVLSEIQRLNTLLPFGLFHTNLENDIEIKGYRIPAGTPIAANLHSVHRDPRVWKHPEDFNPENFLQNGKLVNLDHLIPFSIGRRSCAGEALARMELYIFFASWMKDFKVKLASDDTVPILEGEFRAVYQPEQFEIRMCERTSGQTQEER